MTTPGLPSDAELAAGQPVRAAHLRTLRDYITSTAADALAPSDAAADAAVDRAVAAGEVLSPAAASGTYVGKRHRVFRRNAGLGAKVILRFDDGYRSNLTLAAPIMERYGYVGCMLPATSWIGGPQRTSQDILTVADILELADLGWEIGSHTQSHLDCTQNLATTVAELDGSIADIVGWGLPRPVTFAYPSGFRNAETDKLVYRRFKKCFTTQTAQNNELNATGPTFYLSWSVIGGLVDTDASIEKIKRYIETCFDQGRNAVLGFHGFTEGAPPLDYLTNIIHFEQVMEFLYAGGYPVGLPRDTPPHNLVSDPGFEEWDLPGTYGYPWERGAAGSLWARGTTAANADTGSSYLELNSPASAAANDNIWQIIPVEPGKRYTVRARVNVPAYTAGELRLHVDHLDHLNQAVLSELDKIVVKSTTSGYTDIVTSFEAIGSAPLAKLRFQAFAFQGTARVDFLSVSDSDTVDPLGA